jgi:hypothetical protein
VILSRNGQPFSTGASRFRDSAIGQGEPTAKIFVRFRLPNLAEEFVGQLDTGAAWSIVNWDIAEAAGIRIENGERVRYSGRWGTIEGVLVNCPILISADVGEPLAIESSIFVTADWSAGNFLGYCGLLERIRFALDPKANLFYFGPCD